MEPARDPDSTDCDKDVAEEESYGEKGQDPTVHGEGASTSGTAERAPQESVGRRVEGLGGTEVALAALRRADELGDATGVINLGRMLERRGDEEGALAAYRRADERGDATGAFLLGKMLKGRGNMEDALAAYERARDRLRAPDPLRDLVARHPVVAFLQRLLPGLG